MPPTFMERMVEGARKRRLRVVELHTLGGLSFAEIAAVMKISRHAAWRLWDEAKKKRETPQVP